MCFTIFENGLNISYLTTLGIHVRRGSCACDRKAVLYGNSSVANICISFAYFPLPFFVGFSTFVSSPAFSFFASSAGFFLFGVFGTLGIRDRFLLGISNLFLLWICSLFLLGIRSLFLFGICNAFLLRICSLFLFWNLQSFPSWNPQPFPFWNLQRFPS